MLWFFFLVFCWSFFVGLSSEFAAAAQDQTGVCGISPALERYKIYNPNRIFGGEISNEGDFPWFVHTYIDGKQCSGTIVHESWVMTAAHCLPRNQPPKYISVYYGSANFTKMRRISGVESYVHPNFTSGAKSDIALIKLNGSLEFSENVQPICLNSTVNPEDHEILVMLGMGNDFKKIDKKGKLVLIDSNMVQDSPTVYNKTCGDEKALCVGGINHVALPGDSGGPLLVIRDNRFIQVGVCGAYRWNDYKNEHISAQFTEWYTKISAFCGWIKAITNNDIQC